MRKISSSVFGVAQGDEEVFSDFADGGAMWTGSGGRERRKAVTFKAAFKTKPVVHVGLSLLDVDTSVNLRTDCRAEKITNTGFDLVFRTWSDSRVARIRMSWLAIGELSHPDDWDV